jgi:CheY-like chemotaxis protein
MSDKKILVADYNTRELQHLKKLFTDDGFEVVTVLDGKAALDAFFEENPDVVLLSAMLSKVNGFDVCRQIQDSDTGRNCAVIVATSVYKGQKYRIKAIHENKASEFIEKPFPDDKLLETVRRFLGDTRSLIDTRKGELMEAVVKREELAAEPTVVIPAAAAAPVVPPPARKAPETKAPPAGMPAEKRRPDAGGRPGRPKSDNVEEMLQAEITATLIATDTRSSATESDDSMDRLLSDTSQPRPRRLDKEKPKREAPVKETISQTADGCP